MMGKCVRDQQVCLWVEKHELSATNIKYGVRGCTSKEGQFISVDFERMYAREGHDGYIACI